MRYFIKTNISTLMLTAGALSLLQACTTEPSDPDPVEPQAEAEVSNPDPAVVPNPDPDDAQQPVQRLSDLGSAWQYRPTSGDAFEVIALRDGQIDYETIDGRQAGWRVSGVDNGALDLTYERGPGVSAIPFPNGEGPLFERLNADALRANLENRNLILSSGDDVLVLQPHPANELALPDGQVWGLVESYDDLEVRNPYEFGAVQLGFAGYTAGVNAGCNDGGVSFAQWDGQFIPGPHVMTEMACQNDGDAVASWLLRPGPAFERDGNRLWREFPEGRIIFEPRNVE